MILYCSYITKSKKIKKNLTIKKMRKEKLVQSILVIFNTIYYIGYSLKKD